MAKKKTKISAKSKSKKPRSNKKATPATDQLLRDHVLYLLKGEGAHIGFDDALGEWSFQLTGTKVANFPHTAWMLLEHMRLALWDILEFSRNAKHISPAWPEGYWPTSAVPSDEKAWNASVSALKKNLREMERLVADNKVDLYARLPWGDGQTLLREALLVADHNAYHLGQLVMLRKSIGND